MSADVSFTAVLAVCSEIHTRYTNKTVWAEHRIFMSKLLVRIVTTLLWGGTYLLLSLTTRIAYK
jgi:hypothetical protein